MLTFYILSDEFPIVYPKIFFTDFMIIDCTPETELTTTELTSDYKATKEFLPPIDHSEPQEKGGEENSRSETPCYYECDRPKTWETTRQDETSTSSLSSAYKSSENTKFHTLMTKETTNKKNMSPKPMTKTTRVRKTMATITTRKKTPTETTKTTTSYPITLSTTHTSRRTLTPSSRTLTLPPTYRTSPTKTATNIQTNQITESNIYSEVHTESSPTYTLSSSSITTIFKKHSATNSLSTTQHVNILSQSPEKKLNNVKKLKKCLFTKTHLWKTGNIVLTNTQIYPDNRKVTKRSSSENEIDTSPFSWWYPSFCGSNNCNRPMTWLTTIRHNKKRYTF